MLNVPFLQLFFLSIHLISIDSLNSSVNIKKHPHRSAISNGKGEGVDDSSKKISLHPIPLSDYHALQYGHYQHPEIQVPRYPQIYPNEPIEPIFIPFKTPSRKKPQSPGSEKVISADPLLVLAIITLPLLALLTFTVVVIPLIPIVIYLFAVFGPGVAPIGRRKRTSEKNSLINSSIFKQFNQALNQELFQ